MIKCVLILHENVIKCNVKHYKEDVVCEKEGENCKEDVVSEHYIEGIICIEIFIKILNEK